MGLSLFVVLFIFIIVASFRAELIAVEFKKTRDVSTTCTMVNYDVLTEMLSSKNEMMVVHMFDKENLYFTHEILKFDSQLMKIFMLTYFNTFPCTVLKSSKHVEVNIEKLKDEFVQKFTFKSSWVTLRIPYLSLLVDVVFDKNSNDAMNNFYITAFYISAFLSIVSLFVIYCIIIPLSLVFWLVDLLKYVCYRLKRPTQPPQIQHEQIQIQLQQEQQQKKTR